MPDLRLGGNKKNNNGRSFILAQVFSAYIKTHPLPHSKSCIDLDFTDQPNLVVNCGTRYVLNSICHHQITHCKLNLNIEYPPPQERFV